MSKPSDNSRGAVLTRMLKTPPQLFTSKVKKKPSLGKLKTKVSDKRK